MPKDFRSAHQILKTAVEKGEIAEDELNARVLKILELKEHLRLHEERFTPIPDILELNSAAGFSLKKLLFASVVTPARDRHHLLPLVASCNLPVAYVQLGSCETSHFQNGLEKRFSVDPFLFPFEEECPEVGEELLEKLKEYPLIFFAIYPGDPRRIQKIRLLPEKEKIEALKHFRVHGLSESFLRFIDALQIFEKKTVVTFFGNSFGLHFLDPYSTLIMAHEADPDAQTAASALLRGDAIFSSTKSPI